jgi:hypothetical protein
VADLNVAVRIVGEDHLSGPLGHAQGALGGLTETLGKVGLAGIGLSAVKDAAMGLGNALGIGLASETEKVRAKFTAFLKDSGAVDQALAMVRSEADKTPFSFAAMSSAVAGLIPSAKQAGVSLLDLTQQAEILAASHPEQGLEGAAFALREAVSGDFTSIIERFDLPRQTINKLKAEGVPAMEIVQRAMGEMGYDMSLVGNLAGTTEGRLSTFQDAVDGLRLAAGKPILTALGTQLDRLAVFLDANRERFTALAQIVGNLFARSIEGAARLVMAFIDTAQHLYQQLQPVIETIGARLQPVLEFVSRHLTDFLIPALGALAIAAGAAAVSTIVAMAPIVVPIVAIGAAIALLREAWESDFGGIQEKTAAVWRFLQPIFNAIMDQLALFWERILPELLQTWNAITNKVQEAMAAIWGVIGPVVAQIAQWWTDHWDTISKVLDLALDEMKRILAIAFDLFTGILTAGLRLLRGDWEGAWDAIQGHFGNAWENIKAVLADAVEILKLTLGAALQALLNALLGWAGEAWAAMRDAGRQMVDGILNGLAGLADAVKNALTGAISGALSAAQALLNNFKPTIAAPVVPAPVLSGGSSFQSAILNLASGGGGGSSGGTQTTSPSQPGFDWGAYNADPANQGRPRNPDGTVARQAGGPVWPGLTAWVGEKGPELVTFDRPGYVLPHGMAPSAESRPIEVHIHVAGTVVKSQDLAREVYAGLQELRRKGLALV